MAKIRPRTVYQGQGRVSKKQKQMAWGEYEILKPVQPTVIGMVMIRTLSCYLETTVREGVLHKHAGPNWPKCRTRFPQNYAPRIAICFLVWRLYWGVPVRMHRAVGWASGGIFRILSSLILFTVPKCHMLFADIGVSSIKCLYCCTDYILGMS